MLFVQSVLLVSSSMHWPKEELATFDVPSALLSFAVGAVIILERYENCLIIVIIAGCVVRVLFHCPQGCTKYESCRNEGRHAHHPRDCLFYLRDEDVVNLQKLLNDYIVEYYTEPPKGQVMAETNRQQTAGSVVYSLVCIPT